MKVHGGAISPSFQFSLNGNKPVYTLEAKQEIARKANTLLKKDDPELRTKYNSRLLTQKRLILKELAAVQNAPI